MFERIRSFFFQRALQRALNVRKRQRKIHTLQSARTIGLLFDASVEKIRLEIRDFAKDLEKDGKKVKVVGYFPTTQMPGQQIFDFFFQKETSWTGQPKSEKALAFALEKLDLLICLNPQHLRPIEWICILSPAAMKIGLPVPGPSELDVQLEIPAAQGLRFFTEQLHLYLDKIVLNKNESARAI